MFNHKKFWITILTLFCLMSFSLYGQNLLINPDAESGDTHGWVDPDDAWSADNEITPHSGQYFFWPARKDIPYTEMYQDVNVSSYSASIDAGQLWFNLSGWLANWDQYPHDRSTLALEALNEAGQQLLYVSRDHRSPVWTQYQLEGQVPVGTRTLRVHLIATRFVGSDNDGYFDDLSLVVSNTAPSVYVTVTSLNSENKVAVDSTLQLTAQTIGGVDEGYLWSSSFEAVATVDSNGLVTAHKAGKFTISAIGKNTGKVGTIELTAYNPEDIIFISPEPDEQLLRNHLYEIKWEVKGNISSGTLWFSANGGVDWNWVADIDSVESGHFWWLTPDSSHTLNDCYLKMSWSGGESVSSKFSIVTELTAIEKEKPTLLPSGVILWPAYPNPFNPVTTIRYTIPVGYANQQIDLAVFDALGRKVSTLLQKVQAPGTYSVQFRAENLPSGNYFYQLRVGNSILTKRMTLLK